MVVVVVLLITCTCWYSFTAVESCCQKRGHRIGSEVNSYQSGNGDSSSNAEGDSWGEEKSCWNVGEWRQLYMLRSAILMVQSSCLLPKWWVPRQSQFFFLPLSLILCIVWVSSTGWQALMVAHCTTSVLLSLTCNSISDYKQPSGYITLSMR